MKTLILLAGMAAMLLGTPLLLASDEKEHSGSQAKKAADKFPDGCVSCHIKSGSGKDTRMIAVMKKGHPPLSAVKIVPQDCQRCHKRGSTTDMGVFLHRAHFTDDDGDFASKFGGDCRHCHEMNPKTGKTSLKSGARNW